MIARLKCFFFGHLPLGDPIGNVEEARFDNPVAIGCPRCGKIIALKYSK